MSYTETPVTRRKTIQTPIESE